MFLPVGRADTGVFDGGATVNHHIVAHINSNVGDRPGAGIGTGKENQVPGPGFGFRHNGALVVYPRRRGAGQVVNAGMGVYPADEARAVKTCARGASDLLASIVAVVMLTSQFRKFKRAAG